MLLVDDELPVIDRRVKHVGITKLRGLNADQIREETASGTFVIQDNNTPLAVLVSYEKFLIMQEKMAGFMNTLELLCDGDEVKALSAGLREAAAGNSRSIADIRADLAKKQKG